MKRLLILVTVIGFLMASFVTPLKAQWQVAYQNSDADFYNLSFADTANGWFVGSITIGQDFYKIIHTTDGARSVFEPQNTPTGAYNLYSIFIEDALNGWACWCS